ncbi:MAG TPA: MazG nucleotide pyrophosphohydrolase domain-containing protein, partial [Gammaproteobacteria bacterium]
KARERAQLGGAAAAPASVLDGVALGLPALSRADKLQRRAARAGFDWPEIGPVFAKVEEELAEVRAEVQACAAPERIEAELGDLLFSCVNLARHAGVDPEAALRGANERFARRYRQVEAAFAALERGLHEATPEELDAAWEEAKRGQG